MEKRAQVTMFVVLGIVIVAVIGISLYFRGSDLGASSRQQQSERESLNIDAMQFAESVDKCVEKTLVDAIIDVSRNGGAYPAASGSISYKGYSVPLYYDDGKDLIYSKEKIKSGMEDYITRNLAVCVDGIGKSYELSGTVNAKVSFGKETRAEVSMPLNIGTSKLTYFMGIMDFDYNDVYGDMSSFYGRVKVFNETMEFMGMAELAKSSGYRFSQDYVGDSVIYVLGWDDPVLVSRLEFPFAIRKKESSIFVDGAVPEFSDWDNSEVSDDDTPPEDDGSVEMDANVPVNSEINISEIENDEKVGEIVAKL
ncbi:MAG: hypothetical protein V1906_01435 [Candidatus Woesearchaeota archaeon]